MSLEGICTGDFHFGGYTKHFKHDAVSRQLYEIDKIYQYAVQNGINHLFIAGDISDTPHMDYATYIQLVLFLKKYDGIVNTYYIAGNHDFSDIKKTSLDLLKVLIENGFFESLHLYLSPELVHIDDCPVYFAPYPVNCTIKKRVPKLNIAHVTYTGAIGDNGRKLRAKDEFKQQPGDFTLSGHIHKYQMLKAKRALYAGNPYQKNFGEALPKGFVHFKAGLGKNKINFTHRFINNKPDFTLENVYIESRADFAKLSTSDSVRYKLWLSEGITLPKNLRVDFPNITGGIFDNASKSVVEGREHQILTTSTVVNVTSGLGKFFKKNGFTKDQFTEAKSIVEQAKNELGL